MRKFIKVTISLIFVLFTLPVIAGVNPDGSFSFGVNIKLPPTEQGPVPNLALVYNSNGKNSIVGMGWQLQGLPCITRDSSYPIEYNGNDVYIGSAGRLVKMADGTYHTEEESFSKYETFGTAGDGPMYWVETRRDGTRLYYGNHGTARTANVLAANKNGIRVWALSKVEDVFGNYFTVEYEQHGGYTYPKQVYPKKIIYTYSNETYSSHRIDFSYDTKRPDIFTSYQYGCFTATQWRLTEIAVTTFSEDYTGLTRKYELTYDPDSELSRLIKIQEYGSDGATLPPLEFEYEKDINSASWLSSFKGRVQFHGGSDFRYVPMDINGDGYGDLVELYRQSNDTIGAQFWTGTDLVFTHENKISNIGTWGEDNKYLSMDVNGDSRPDLVIISPSGGSAIASVWLSEGETLTHQSTNNIGDWSDDCQYNSMDVNGDGRSDLVNVFKNTDGNADAAVWVSNGTGFSFKSTGSAGGWGVSHQYKPMDVNGDGSVDLVHFSIDANGKSWAEFRVSDGNGFNLKNNAYLGADGYGRHYIPVNMNNDNLTDLVTIYQGSDGQAYLEGQISDSNRFYSGNRVHIGVWSSDHKFYAMDVDGDGITDIAQLYNNQGKGYVKVWTPKYTDSGYIFYSRGERFLGCWGDNCRYYSIDLNGDGSNDLIELSKSPFDSTVYMSTFMPPKCLSTIRNGMGGTIDISYHNRGYIINPGESNYPVINDKTHATFVSSVTKTDGSGGSYISNYEYSNAKVYTGFPYERKNLYFETVTELCPATETRRVVYYKQDPVFRGKPLRVQEFAKEVLVKDITYEYEDNTSTPFSIAGEGTTTLTRLKSVTIKTYNTDKSLLLTTVSENLERDSFGNITLSKLTKIPAGSTSKSYYEARNFINQTDSGNWIIGLPESFDKYVNDSSNYDNIITKETYEYNNKFQPLKIRAWFINQQGEVTWAETINEYYTNGLLQSTTTPDNIKTVYTYGSENIIEVFPLADVSKKITRTLRKDYRYGKTSQYTNEHGFRAVIERDEFGRETGAVLYEGASGPENGSKIRESFTEYQFNDDGESYIQVCTKYGDFFDGDVCRRTYYNGLLRNYKTITPAVEGDTDSGRYTAQYIKYDSAGRSAQISDSYYTGLDASLPGESIKWTNKEFDSLGRIARITIPGNNDRVIEYNYNNDLESGLVGSETVIQKNPLNDLMDIQKQVFYNIDGKPVRIIEDKDGINVLSRFEYDTLGRLIKTIVADKETIIEYYRGTGLQKSITDPNAGKTEYTYFDTPGDPRFGSLEKETRPAPNGPGFITITNEYNDPYGRLTGQVSPDRTVGFHYDDYESYTGDPGSFGVGRLTYSSITTDEYKLTTKYDYDIFGETVKVTRDIEDDILCTGDAVGMPCHAEIGRELDRLGRTRKTVYPDDSEIEYSYFGGSGIINKITEGDTVHAAYSGINKRAQAGVIEYGNQVKTVFSYKTDGVLDDMKTSLEDKTYLHYSYDFYNNGNIRAITDHLNYQESAGAIDLSVQYSYDAMNRISSVTQNSKTLNYEFDGNSGSIAGRGNLTGKAGSSLEYYPGSTKVRSITDTSGSTTNYSWSTSGNLLSKSNPSSSFSYTYNSENMLEKSEGDKGETKFYYDDTGQRFLKIYDNREGTVIKTYSSGIYEYRIKLIDGTVDEVKGTKYIIGANGKVLAANTKDLTGAVSSTGVQIPDEVKKKSGLINGFMDKISNSIKQFAGISFNDLFLPAFVLILLSFITIISARNIFGLVLSINRSGTLEKGSRRLVSFCIGNKTFTLGINRKGKRVTGFASRHPVYAHIALVCSLLTLSLFGCGQDIVVPGGVSMPPEYGGLPVGTLYFHTNHLGSSALITDEEGNEVSRVNYLPYGEVQKEYSGVYNQGNGFIEDASGSVSSHFTGQQYDYESGLYYYNARYYDPGAGAFTSADSIIPDPGSSLAYNRHMYVAGNPVMFADPTGHSWDGLKDFVMGIALFFVDPHDDGVSLGLGDLVGINISWGGESGNGGSIYIGDKDGNFAGIGYYNNRGPDEHYFLIGAGMGAKPSAPEQTDPFNRPLPPPPSSGDKDSGGSKDGGGSSVIDGVQIGLDALGMVPVVGFVFDIVNAGVSAFRGNWGDAAFSLGAAIPGIGQGIGAAKMIKAGVKAGVAATSLVKKMDTARKLGKAGEEAAGIYKNTKRIMKGTATGVNYRIPDGLTKKVVQEVKNVSRLSNTRQLRDYARFAKDTGRRFELFIRPTTKMSGPLLDAITNGDIFLRFLP